MASEEDSKTGRIYWWRASTPELGQYVSSRSWVQIDGNERDPDAPLPVFLNLATSTDGRTVCQAMIIGKLAPFSAGPDEVTSRALREIPVSTLIETALSSGKMPDDYGQAIRALLENLPVTNLPKRRPGPNGLSDEYLEMVALLYRQAVAGSKSSPIGWMAKKLDRSEVTVRRHIQRARDKGILGPSTPGKAGEQPKEGS